MEALSEVEEQTEGSLLHSTASGQIVTDLGKNTSQGHSQGESHKASLAGPVRRRRASISMRSSRNSRAGNIPLTTEPTYRMEPKIAFSSDRVYHLIKEIVDLKITSMPNFQPKQCRLTTRSLSDELKARVRDLSYDRYKIIALVVIVENHGQAQVHSSRCLWNAQTDTFTEYIKELPQVVCIAAIFGIYHE